MNNLEIQVTNTREREAGRMCLRDFLKRSGILAVGAAVGCQTAKSEKHEPIIDIHQHVLYHDRSDDKLFAHQRAMGIARTILRPAGRSVNTLSTNHGESNGLE